MMFPTPNCLFESGRVGGGASKPLKNKRKRCLGTAGSTNGVPYKLQCRLAGKGDVLKYHATPQRDSGAESGVKTFLRESVRSWPTTAALLPSSRALADSLIRYIDFGSARTIVELGVGTGAITSEILCRIKPDARIYALDISSIFIEHVRQKFNDPRLVPILADARELTDVLGVWKLGRVDAVVSSLGLTCMDNDARLAVFDQVTRCLSNQGVFTQYQYIHARAIPGWCGRIGISGFNVAKFLRRYFQNVSAETVLWNAPPALVYTCQW